MDVERLFLLHIIKKEHCFNACIASCSIPNELERTPYTMKIEKDCFLYREHIRLCDNKNKKQLAIEHFIKTYSEEELFEEIL